MNLSSISVRDMGLAALITALWGVHFVVIRVGALEVTPYMLLSIRFSLAGLIFLPFTKRITFSQFKGVLSYAIPYLVLHLGLLFVALKDLEAGLASLIIQMEMPFIVLLGWFFYRETFGLKTAFGLLLALGGVVLIVYQPFDMDFSYLAASMIVLSAFCWAVGALRMRSIQNVDFASLTFYSHAIALPFAVLGSFVMDQGQFEVLQNVDYFKLGFVVFYQVFLMSICLYWWKGLMQRNPVYLITPFTLLVPVFAVLSSVLFLGEVLQPNAIIGGILVLAGVGIVVIRKAQKEASV